MLLFPLDFVDHKLLFLGLFIRHNIFGSNIILKCRTENSIVCLEMICTEEVIERRRAKNKAMAFFDWHWCRQTMKSHFCYFASVEVTTFGSRLIVWWLQILKFLKGLNELPDTVAFYLKATDKELYDIMSWDHTLPSSKTLGYK